MKEFAYAAEYYAESAKWLSELADKLPNTAEAVEFKSRAELAAYKADILFQKVHEYEV